MRTALVTGASKGIGRAAALGLASDGYAVACAFGADEAGAKETARAIEEGGGTAAAFGGDVADETQVAELFRQVAAWREAPLVLIANAGVNRDGLSVKFPLAEFRRVVDVNLQGTFLCARAALPAMLKARWGRLVAVSSVAGIRGNAGQVAYSASKHAVVGLTRTLAREYGGRGITANAVCPGFVETEMTSGLSPKGRDALLAQIPAGRFGTVDEVAAAIRFLASEKASYVNGSVIAIDGGMTA